MRAAGAKEAGRRGEGKGGKDGRIWYEKERKRGRRAETRFANVLCDELAQGLARVDERADAVGGKDVRRGLAQDMVRREQTEDVRYRREK
jgi:hypothetical protein